VTFVLQIIPTFALYRGLLSLSDGVSGIGTGLTMSDLSDKTVALQEVYLFLLVEWIILMLFAIYLENVVPSPIGVKKDCFFCFRPSYWRPAVKTEKAQQLHPDPEWGSDVLEEAQRAHSQRAAIRMLNLHKKYQPSDGGPEFTAVKSLSLNVHHGECFGFLGPNGAGKSTTINMLCGYLQPSGGVAYLYGWNVEQDADAVHMLM
jgi:ABC-type multidrug transport system fused ATPase/permease subunit